jgi:hypothetical protein
MTAYTTNIMLYLLDNTFNFIKQQSDKLSYMDINQGQLKQYINSTLQEG